MPKITDSISTADGTCPVRLFLPDGSGPWPGVVMYPDAGGVRDTFDQMAAELAGFGYAVLLPDVYYRSGEWAPFDMATVFADQQERNRLFAM
ncbi:dienelactone hydrolase family protein, partial [Mycobacterium avium]